MHYCFGIAMEKCGTTSFHQLLQDMPQFNTVREKEAFFFNRNYDQGWTYYESLFQAPFSDDRIITDITPAYFRSEQALNRIAKLDGRKSILIFLRDPISRAFSHYCHDIRLHFSTGMLSNNFRRVPDISFDGMHRRGHHYFIPYMPVIQTAFDLFGRENCHILLLEDMANTWRKTSATLAENLGFGRNIFARTRLPKSNDGQGIPRFFRWEQQAKTKIWDLYGQWADGTRKLSGLKKAHVNHALALQGMYTLQISAEQFAAYSADFREDILSLSDLLGRDLSHWLEPRALSVEFCPVSPQAQALGGPVREVIDLSDP